MIQGTKVNERPATTFSKGCFRPLRGILRPRWEAGSLDSQVALLGKKKSSPYIMYACHKFRRLFEVDPASSLGMTATTTTVATPLTTTTVQAYTSVILQAPAVAMNNYLDDNCITPTDYALELTVYADRTCYPVYTSNSNLNIQFVPRNYGVTADQCAFNLYSQDGCQGTLLQSFPSKPLCVFQYQRCLQREFGLSCLLEWIM